MRMTLKACARLVLSGALAVAAIGAAEAKMTVDDLVGIWRPQFEDHPKPDLTACADAPDKDVCAAHQGTYMRGVYLQIAETQGGGLKLISDGLLWAEITPNKDHSRRFDVAFGKNGTARLRINTDDCTGVDKCFQIDGSTDTVLLPNDVYTPMTLRKPDSAANRTDGDNFSRMPASFDLAVRCFDIAAMNLNNFQDRGDCAQHVFVEIDEMKDTQDYYIYTDAEKENILVPLGWTYVEVVGGTGGGRTRILESQSDVIHSESQQIGSNSGLDLGIINFSMSRNETTRSRVEKMNSDSTTYAQYEFIETSFAIVLDKANARLNPAFQDYVVNTLAKQDEPDFKRLIANFGTHYSHATTMGATGRLFSRVTSESVLKLHESGVDIEDAMSAGVSIPTEAGTMKSTDGGSSAQSSSDHDQMKSTLGGDFGTYYCAGGVSCDGQHASGEAWVPVLLDLRPISDLLGPPFFPELSIAKRHKLKLGLAQAIREHAFTEAGVSRNPAAQFLRVATEPKAYGFQGLMLSCKQDFENTSQKSMARIYQSGTCGKFTGTTLVSPARGGIMTYGDIVYADFNPPAGADKPLLFLPGDPIQVSTTVERGAIDCSITANDNNDNSTVSGVASGQATVPAPPPVTLPNAYVPGKDAAIPANTLSEDQVWMVVELVQPSCDDEAGGVVTRGGAFAFIAFDPLTASDLLK